MALHGSGAVHCSRDVKIVPDTTIAEASKAAPYDVVVMPGGANGAKNLAAVNYSSFISVYIPCSDFSTVLTFIFRVLWLLCW